MSFLNGTKRMDSMFDALNDKLEKVEKTLQAHYETGLRQHIRIQNLKKNGSPSAPGICDIIETCGKAGVYEFNYRGLMFKMSPKKELFYDTPEQKVNGLEELNSEQYKVSKEDLLAQEQIIKQSQLEEMQLTDPALYEEMLAAGELYITDELEASEEQ